MPATSTKISVSALCVWFLIYCLILSGNARETPTLLHARCSSYTGAIDGFMWLLTQLRVPLIYVSSQQQWSIHHEGIPPNLNHQTHNTWATNTRPGIVVCIPTDAMQMTAMATLNAADQQAFVIRCAQASHAGQSSEPPALTSEGWPANRQLSPDSAYDSCLCRRSHRRRRPSM